MRRSASTHGRRNRGVLGWHYPTHFWDPGVQLPSYQAFLIISKRKLHRSSEISNVLYVTDFLVCISIAPRNNVCGAREFSVKLGIFSETSREITHFSPWIRLVSSYYVIVNDVEGAFGDCTVPVWTINSVLLFNCMLIVVCNAWILCSRIVYFLIVKLQWMRANKHIYIYIF